MDRGGVPSPPMTQSPPLLAGLRVEGRRACVVGEGHAAERRVRDLVRAGADVRAVGPRWSATDFDGCFIVVVCTAAWQEPVTAAREAGALVYVPDVPAASDLVMAAIVRRGDLQVAVSTGGRSPAAARRLMELLDGWLPAGAADTLDTMGAVRDRLRREGAELPAYETWARALDAGLAAADGDGARAAVTEVLGRGV